MTILWNEVTIWWNEVTKGWNEVAWNEVVMERSDRNSSSVLGAAYKDLQKITCSGQKTNSEVMKQIIKAPVLGSRR